MTKINYQECIRGIKNDIKMAIDDAFCVLENIADDVDRLKAKSNKDEN